MLRWPGDGVRTKERVEVQGRDASEVSGIDASFQERGLQRVPGGLGFDLHRERFVGRASRTHVGPAPARWEGVSTPL